MGLCTLNAWLIDRALDSGAVSLQLLHFPDLLMVGEPSPRLQRTLLKEARTELEELDPAFLYTRWAPERVETGRLELTTETRDTPASPPRPVDLHFHYLRWQISAGLQAACVPDLQIEVTGRDSDDLLAQLKKEVLAALNRKGAIGSLPKLVAYQRTTGLRVERVTIQANLKPPRDRAAEVGRGKAQKSVLLEAGEDLRRATLLEACEYDDLVKRLAETLGGNPSRSVLLIGPSGVGKTAVFHELVRQGHYHGFGATPFYATSGSRLVAGQNGYGMWQERCRRMVREAANERAIVHLGSLVELMEVGQHVHSSQSIAAFLRPFLHSGELLAVVEALPEQLSPIDEQDPLLLQSFERIEIEEPSPEKALRILQRCGEVSARRRGSRWQPGAIEEAEQLHRRYASYSAHPGRPLRFLERILADAPPQSELGAPRIMEAFSRQTGLPRFMLDDALPLDLEAARRFFADRVIGQPEPVRLVVDLLAMTKARLVRPRRPLASLLFIGPTGVGKTELAKALAEFLFSDPARLTRYDMSEFSDPVSVQRLISGSTSEREGLLTARVREQPFSVLLFDEFEKADPLFFDLLLQVLGEARLTDAQGRLADFSNAVVILTSNLGAQDFQRGRPGLVSGEADVDAATRHFTRAVQEFVRPELYNRFDRVVPFQALSRETILAICRRELDLIRRRDGVALRGVELNTSAEVVEWLAQSGFDPRYGARPLQRTIEKHLLAPIAATVNTQAADYALVAATEVREGKLNVRVSVRNDAAGRPVPARASQSGEAALANRAADVRRNLQRLERSGEMLEVTSELLLAEMALRRAAKASKKGRHKGKPEVFNAARYRELKSTVEALAGSLERSIALEENALLQLYSSAGLNPETAAGVAVLEHNWRGFLLQVYALQFDEPHRVTVTLFCEHREFLFSLSREYLSIARELKYKVASYRYMASPARKAKGKDDARPVHMQTKLEREEREAEARWHRELGDRPLMRERLDDPGVVLCRTDVPAIGFGFEFTGTLAFIRFCTEAGHHVLSLKQKLQPCFVETTQVLLKDYVPPAGVERMGALPLRRTRRTYIPPLTIKEDPLLEDTERPGSLRVADAIERHLQQCAERLMK